MNIQKLAFFSAAFFFAYAVSYAAEAEKNKTPEMPKAGEPANKPAKGQPGFDFRRGPGMSAEWGKRESMEKHGNHQCKDCEKKAKKNADNGFEYNRGRIGKNAKKEGFFRHFGKGFFRDRNNYMRPQCKLQEEELMSLVKDADSAFAKSLKSMKKDSAHQYKKAIISLKGRICFVKDKKSDKAKEVIKKAVASVKIETEVAELVSKYRKASKENKPAVKNELKTVLEKLFDMRIEEQKMRIQAMEEALAEQKKSVEEKNASKNRIVETKLDEMTGENFRW